MEIFRKIFVKKLKFEDFLKNEKNAIKSIQNIMNTLQSELDNIINYNNELNKKVSLELRKKSISREDFHSLSKNYFVLNIYFEDLLRIRPKANQIINTIKQNYEKIIEADKEKENFKKFKELLDKIVNLEEHIIKNTRLAMNYLSEILSILNVFKRNEKIVKDYEEKFNDTRKNLQQLIQETVTVERKELSECIRSIINFLY